VADRRLLVNVSEEYALPQPLAEARKEQQSLRRELHTVNVGADCFICAYGEWRGAHSNGRCQHKRLLTYALLAVAAIGTNLAIFLAKLGVFSFTGSK
jgi:hypothetical protein